jgi:hypothetical protein
VHQDLIDLESASIQLEMAALEVQGRQGEPNEVFLDLHLLTDLDSLSAYTAARVNSMLGVVSQYGLLIGRRLLIDVQQLGCGLDAAVAEGIIVGMLLERSRHEVQT